MLLRLSSQTKSCEMALHVAYRSLSNGLMPCRLTGYIQVSEKTTEYTAIECYALLFSYGYVYLPVFFYCEKRKVCTAKITKSADLALENCVN